ncbi:MAG: DUF4831 family protein [Bacteroidales bacterium]|nr:DUF4831 family protein [Bacteroidales bacterium]
MNKNILRRSVLLLVSFLMVSLSWAQDQYQVTKMTGKNPPVGKTGIYYSLPKTVFKVKLVLEEITRTPGPFADFTQKYLGTDQYIHNKENYYRLLAVKVTPVAMADPSEVFFVSFPFEKQTKNARAIEFQLDKYSGLISFGPKPQAPKVKGEENTPSQLFVYSNSGSEENFKMAASYSRAQKLDTLVRKITIDTVTVHRFLFRTSWVNLTTEDQANDAAQEIEKIRKSRYNLLTGYQEVNYGEGIKYMDKELQKLEHQYLVLFLGKETKQVVIRTFEFDPEKAHTTDQLMQFVNKDGNRENITFHVDPVNKMTAVGNANNTAINGLFYRIPVKAAVQVKTGNTVFYSDIFDVPQLGVLSTITMDNASLQFDPTTGSVVRIKKD